MQVKHLGLWSCAAILGLSSLTAQAATIGLFDYGFNIDVTVTAVGDPLPAWIDYMRVVLAGTKDVSPEVPEGIITVRIDPKTGLRAPAGTPDAMFEVFREENVPEK